MVEMDTKRLKKAIKALQSHATLSNTNSCENSIAQSEPILSRDKLLNFNTGLYVMSKLFEENLMVVFWDICDYNETSYIELDTSNCDSAYKDSVKTNGISCERDLVIDDREEISTNKIEIKF